MAQTTDQLLLSTIDQIRRILTVIATKGMKQREQITLLSKAGLKPKDIAELLGTSSNTVRVELVALRKASSGRKGRKKVQASREAE